jgi:hypothetical protein
MAGWTPLFFNDALPELYDLDTGDREGFTWCENWWVISWVALKKLPIFLPGKTPSPPVRVTQECWCKAISWEGYQLGLGD